MVLKRMNKRGQDYPTATIIGIILLVIVLVMLVWGLIFGGFETLGKIRLFGTSSLDSIVASCNVPNIGQEGFCVTLRGPVDVSGNSTYVTCNYLRSQFPDRIGVDMACGEPNVDQLKQACVNLKKTNFKINGKTYTNTDACSSISSIASLA